MDRDLYNAATSGDVSFLSNEDIKTRNLLSQLTATGSSVLHLAAEFGHLEFFKEADRLCSPPLLVKQANSKGDTPLHSAVRGGSTEVVRFIIEQAKELFSDIEEGHEHDVKGYKEVLRMENLDGDNALHLAARHTENSDLAELLIEADPQLSIILNSKSQESACFIALAERNILVAKVLLSSSNPSCSLLGQINGVTAMHALTIGYAFWDIFDVPLKVMEAAPDMIGQGDDIGWTPLHYAASYGRDNLVKLLLEKNKSAAYKLDIQDGRSALHIAAFLGKVNSMKAIIQACPDCVNLVDNRGRNALHAAVLGCEEDAVKFMLSLPGTSLFSEADQDGNTPRQLVDSQKDNSGIKDVFEEKLGYEMDDMRRTKNPYIEKKEEMDKKKNPSSSNTTKLDEGDEDDYYNGYYQFSATLIATVTFTAAFTLPGGFIQSGGKDEGMAVLISKPAFQAFIVFDILAFFASFSIIVLLLFNRVNDGGDQGAATFKYRTERAISIYLIISYLGMALAFCCGLYVVLGDSIVFSIVVLLLSLIGTLVALFGNFLGLAAANRLYD